MLAFRSTNSVSGDTQELQALALVSSLKPKLKLHVETCQIAFLPCARSWGECSFTVLQYDRVSSSLTQSKESSAASS